MQTTGVDKVQTVLLRRQRVLNTEKVQSFSQAIEVLTNRKKNEELIKILTEVQEWKERKE